MLEVKLVDIIYLIALVYLYVSNRKVVRWYSKALDNEREEKEEAIAKLEESDKRIESMLSAQKQIKHAEYTVVRCEPNVGKYEKGLLYKKMAKDLGEKLLSNGSIELDTRTSEDNITTVTMRICVIENNNPLLKQ